MNEFFFFLNMTCDLRTELNVIPEPFRFAWGIGDRHVSVPPSVLVRLHGCTKAFFFPFCCLRLRNRVFLLAPWRTMDSPSDKKFSPIFSPS